MHFFFAGSKRLARITSQGSAGFAKKIMHSVTNSSWTWWKRSVQSIFKFRINSGWASCNYSTRYKWGYMIMFYNHNYILTSSIKHAGYLTFAIKKDALWKCSGNQNRQKEIIENAQTQWTWYGIILYNYTYRIFLPKETIKTASCPGSGGSSETPRHREGEPQRGRCERPGFHPQPGTKKPLGCLIWGGYHMVPFKYHMITIWGVPSN